MRMPKYAVYTGTRNLYERMVPAVKSLLMHSDVDKVYLLIEDDTLMYDDETYCIPEGLVETINVSKQTFFKPDGPNMKSKFTYMAMMRAALCEVFPDYDRILSLDVDTIVNKDISELWDIPLGDKYYFGAVLEPSRSGYEGLKYTNIGVAMYNLRKLRDGKAKQVIDILNTKPYRFVEQDVFNYECERHILLIDQCYNVTAFTAPSDHPKIIHFAGIKDWTDDQLYLKYAERSWNEILAYRRRTYPWLENH